jgi:hypothetical protein
MKGYVRGLVVAGVAVALLGATVGEASAAVRLRGVTFTNDLVTLVASFSEVGLKPAADVTVRFRASSRARYACLLPTGKASGTEVTVSAGPRSSKVSGRAAASGVFAETAYLDPGLVYPDCPGRQRAHLLRVCFTNPRLADEARGVVYTDPNVDHLCIRTG